MMTSYAARLTRFTRSLRPTVGAALACGLLAAALPSPSHAQEAASGPPQIAQCQPGGPCATPLPVRMVVVSLFEIGEDSGDAAGEFQLWKERRRLTTRIPFPQGFHDLYYDPDTGLLAMVTGVGTARSASAAMALGLDQRFDLSHAYWLIAGIAGIDPQDASIGSAAWAGYLVDGDLAHEIDPREIPADWKYGYFPRRAQGPNDLTPRAPDGEMFVANLALRDWAYALTKDIALPDDPGIAKERAKYIDHPNAQRPPFVLKGDELSAMTFWHGAMLNDWANHWVDYWSQGKGEFVTSAMEDTGIFQAMTYLDRIGRVDSDRVMVLRAGSNYTMPPPGRGAAENLLAENKGYAGLNASVESLYLVGSKVVDEILGHWNQYQDHVPE